MGDKLGVSDNYVGQLEGGRTPGPTLEKLFGKIEAEELQQRGEVPESPREAVQHTMRKAGLDYRDLARLTRYSAAALERAVTGETRASEPMLRAIAKALHIDAEQLMQGSDEAVVREGVRGTFGAKPDVVPPPGQRAKYIPLISMAQAGTMGAYAFTDGGFTYEGTLAFDPKDPKAYGVIIKGDSMSPQFSDGDTAIVYPSFPPQIGKPVICRLNDDEGGSVMFKLYSTKDDGQRVILASYNPRFEPVDYDRSKFAWIHPVAFVMKAI